ncbi:TRAP transporter fused permease subunit [Mesorhizobium sp. B3-2-1]|uniref:TRAP transporter permease n=1 Tax=Mesorhizobium sp. B3-2-1 TaxID=2589891 RepID=UPI001128B034|nr:TRAP transporter permease [Mesorhizobium sp. B3-2-1]TPI29838.1 TRAP transporter fused permease subunit [Mesorhizobium sp. B3-2-1]
MTDQFRKAGAPEDVDIDRLNEIVAEADTGGRKPTGLAAHLVLAVALAWSLFQLWYSSPIPFMLGFGVVSDGIARSIHLAFALFLALVTFPAFKSSSRSRVPLPDWILAIAGAAAALYLVVFYGEIATRPGLPTTADLVISIIGIVILMEAARRAVGPAITVIAGLMLIYIFVGPYMPGLLAHKGATLSRAASQMWLTSEGVFGVALGVSTNVVFMFVLFGTLLERAGAGGYFILLAFSILGKYRGGPAKAGVVASGLTGMISGSSIANVVTTGTFTIPLMKRVGYTPVKAGAIECAAGVNGQIMPPVMGAAAFLIAEYVGISYAEVVKHAFFPALLTYGSLFYIVDIEAMKMGLKGLPSRSRHPALQGALRSLMGICAFVILAGLVYYGIGWTKTVFGSAATWMIVAALAVVYVGLVAYRAKHPDLPLDSLKGDILEIPHFGETARTGLHFLLPVVLLIWCLMVEELSPGLSAFWGSAALMVLVVTQRPLTAFFRKQDLMPRWREGFVDLIEGLSAAARNMTTVGIATATAGIIVGTVLLTGVGLVMTELVEFISAGSFIVMLLFTALICIILGMGMPTTASYVVVATLMAPVMVDLAAQNDLAVPLVAVHLFVFYFGLMADVTPPVGLAAYAAAAISGADPVKTGFQGFKYEIRTALLPFIFIFNNGLLMIDIQGPLDFIMVIATSALAMVAFVAATQNWFLVRNRWYEAIALLLICFTLFRPGYWLDLVDEPFVAKPVSQLNQTIDATPAGQAVRVKLKTVNINGDEIEKLIRLDLAEGKNAAERLESAGLTVSALGDTMTVGIVRLGSQAAKFGLQPGDEIIGVMVPSSRPSRYWFVLPALLLFGLVFWLQRRRRADSLAAAAAP